MNVIVPDFLVERLAPAVREVAPGATTIGIDAEGRTSEDPAAAIGLLRYFPNDRVIGGFGGSPSCSARHRRRAGCSRTGRGWMGCSRPS